jgi:hypothetical protein
MTVSSGSTAGASCASPASSSPSSTAGSSPLSAEVSSAPAAVFCPGGSSCFFLRFRPGSSLRLGLGLSGCRGFGWGFLFCGVGAVGGLGGRLFSLADLRLLCAALLLCGSAAAAESEPAAGSYHCKQENEQGRQEISAALNVAPQ